jgi:hypothetical protein
MCAYCKGASFAPKRTKLPAGTQVEQCFFEEYMLHTARGGDVVRITEARAVLGDKTFALANIAAVTLNDRQELVDFQKAQQAAAEASRGQSIMAWFLLGGLIAWFGFASAGEGIGTTGVIIVMFAVLRAVLGGDKAEIQRMYTIQIHAAGTATDTIVTFDRAVAMRVQAALNQAIVKRSSQRRF